MAVKKPKVAKLKKTTTNSEFPTPAIHAISHIYDPKKSKLATKMRFTLY